MRVFYDATGAASYLFHPTIGPSSAWNANPANSPGAGGMFRAGGYLGVDSAGTLCWAVPQDYTYATYSQLCELQTVSTVGATTTLRCQTMSSVPPPTSGDTMSQTDDESLTRHRTDPPPSHRQTTDEALVRPRRGPGTSRMNG